MLTKKILQNDPEGGYRKIKPMMKSDGKQDHGRLTTVLVAFHNQISGKEIMLY